MADTLAITVPIIRPKGVEGIERKMEGHNISFSEKGQKSGGVVTLANWSNFLQIKLQQLDRKIAKVQAKGGNTDELESLKENMELWQSNQEAHRQAIQTASTKTGSTLSINVFVFKTEGAEKVDWAEIEFTKELSVESRARYADRGAGTKALKALATLGIWNLVNHIEDEHAENDETEMTRTLQREEVAKYFLAKAYKPALALHGVNIEIMNEGA